MAKTHTGLWSGWTWTTSWSMVSLATQLRRALPVSTTQMWSGTSLLSLQLTIMSHKELYWYKLQSWYMMSMRICEISCSKEWRMDNCQTMSQGCHCPSMAAMIVHYVWWFLIYETHSWVLASLQCSKLSCCSSIKELAQFMRWSWVRWMLGYRTNVK